MHATFCLRRANSRDIVLVKELRAVLLALHVLDISSRTPAVRLLVADHKLAQKGPLRSERAATHNSLTYLQAGSRPMQSARCTSEAGVQEMCGSELT